MKDQLYDERMLLYVDPQGYVVIATRNPDTAKNVLGAGTRLDGTPALCMGLAGGMALRDDIQHAAEFADNRQDTAVVYWDNYDAPNLVAAGTSSAAAEAAAPTPMAGPLSITGRSESAATIRRALSYLVDTTQSDQLIGPLPVVPLSLLEDPSTPFCGTAFPGIVRPAQPMPPEIPK
ncbi:MAG: hypothetical protein ACRC20_12465 [Segniliparus sp.]|uniref:hypothetical protein n=1 Tax=Segniliparus sp. TaxID=2804064 RepID=UPI003F30F545